MSDSCFEQSTYALMNKLSHRSPELYIFWENYNRLYAMYAESCIEIEHLRRELERKREEPRKDHQAGVGGRAEIEVQLLKQRNFDLEKQVADLRSDISRCKLEAEKLTACNSTLRVQTRSYQDMAQQFREENTIQQSNIEDILLRLRQAEESLRDSRVREVEAERAAGLLERSRIAEDKCRVALMDKDMEIHMMAVSMEEMRITFERVLSDTMKATKQKFIELLPQLLSRVRNARHFKDPSDEETDTSAEKQGYEMRCEVTDTLTVSSG